MRRKQCVAFFPAPLNPNIFSPNKHSVSYDLEASKTYVDPHANWSLQLTILNKISNDLSFVKITKYQIPEETFGKFLKSFLDQVIYPYKTSGKYWLSPKTAVL